MRSRAIGLCHQSARPIEANIEVVTYRSNTDVLFEQALQLSH
jgi:hypothetical protein